MTDLKKILKIKGDMKYLNINEIFTQIYTASKKSSL